MMYLMNEMIFLLLATALLSMLLGRFLCTSDERAVLAEKKCCQAELLQMQKQRDEWETRSNHWRAKLEESTEQLAEKTYLTSSLETQLEVAAKERESLLIEVNKNDICKARLSSVLEQLECVQSQLQASLAKFEQSQAKIKQLTTANSGLEEEIKQVKQQFDALLKRKSAYKKHCYALRDHNEALKLTESEYYQLKESFAELNQEHQKLIRLNTKLQENQKNLALLQKLQAENKELHALREQAAQLLEERDQLYEDNQYLQNELANVSAEHEEHRKLLHKLMSQRDDFLSRLHAVSSVVGAMNVGRDEQEE